MSIVSKPDAQTAQHSGARRICDALLGERGVTLGAIDDVTRSASRAFLAAALGQAARLEIDVPPGADAPRRFHWSRPRHRAQRR
jgi:hypothetical protein